MIELIRGAGIRSKVLSGILLLTIVSMLGTLGFVIITHGEEESFTEFYILGLSGKATDYPIDLKVGQQGKVIVGIINREHEKVSYRVEVTIDGAMNNEVKAVMLEPDEIWEAVVDFVPKVAGDDQRVEFLLFKNGEVEPCLEPLYLRLDVEQAE